MDTHWLDTHWLLVGNNAVVLPVSLMHQLMHWLWVNWRVGWRSSVFLPEFMICWSRVGRCGDWCVGEIRFTMIPGKAPNETWEKWTPLPFTNYLLEWKGKKIGQENAEAMENKHGKTLGDYLSIISASFHWLYFNSSLLQVKTHRDLSTEYTYQLNIPLNTLWKAKEKSEPL